MIPPHSPRALRFAWLASPLIANKLYLLASGLLLFLVLLTVFAPWIAPFDPNLGDLDFSLASPSANHWFGTDQQGRDILSRLIWGGRSTLAAALTVMILSTWAGTLLGLLAGYFKGLTDSVISRTLEAILAFPPLLLALVVASVFGRGLENSILALSITYTPLIARVVRSVVLLERESQYVQAARALGASDSRILLKHILRNVGSMILVQSSLDLGYAILDLAALGFLGLGVQPPTPDWGAMLSDGREQLLVNPSEALAAGVAVMLSVIALNLVGDGLRAHFDPKRKTVPHASSFQD